VATHRKTKLADEKKTENENKSEIMETVPLRKNQKREIENRHGVGKQFHCNKLNPRWIKEESETTSVSR